MGVVQNIHSDNSLRNRRERGTVQTGTVPGQGRYIMTTQSSSPDWADAQRTTRSLGMLSLSILLLVLVIPALVWGEEKGFSATSATKESEGSMNSQIELMALDQKNWRNPQSAFKWIAMARGFKVPWDTFGRQGWMTDDAYVDPVDPGVSEFSADTEIFYLVFAISALDAPSQYRAAWFHMPDGHTPSDRTHGNRCPVSGNERKSRVPGNLPTRRRLGKRESISSSSISKVPARNCTNPT